MNVATTAVNPSRSRVPKAKGSGSSWKDREYCNAAMLPTERALCDELKEKLEAAGGGTWSRLAVVRQALRVLARELGVPAPPPVLPLMRGDRG